MAKRQFAAQAATMLFAGSITLCSGFASAQTTGADDDPGWYFGLHGGSGKLSGTENNVSTDGGSTPAGEPFFDLLQLGVTPEIIPPGTELDALCFSPLDILLCSDGPGGTGNPGSAASFKSTFKNGPVYGLQFGYSNAGGLRPEMTLSYRKNEFEQVTFNSTGLNSQAEGNLESLSLGGTLWYDLFNKDSSIRPYLGAGIGASQLKIKDFAVTSGTTTTTLEDKQTEFSYLLGAGIGVRLGQSVMLSLDYRYLSAGETEFETGGGSTISSDYDHSSILLGLNFFLKPRTPAFGDADGDGVPDNLDKCPDTPLGIAVDANGCPADSDGDGIADHLDKCPGTKTGMRVGPDGCPLDADGDGVADALDRCPGSPAGVAVGPDGCPLDSDNDGVPDNLDKCPGTPAGAVVDANGCEPDGDGDGIPDRLDRCPDTPPGEKVGPNGCPNDSDGDGVPDDQDECPNTPAGARVLANGCALKGDCRTPRPGEEVDENGCAVDQTFILRGVNFEFDSDRLTPEAKEILKQVAQTLQAYPDVNVEIAGHTDSIGTDAYNLGLSEKRSISVKNFLMGEGVSGARMSPNGYGETQPIDTNDTEDGQAKNRRVELRVIEEGSKLGQ